MRQPVKSHVIIQRGRGTRITCEVWEITTHTRYESTNLMATTSNMETARVVRAAFEALAVGAA